MMERQVQLMMAVLDSEWAELAAPSCPDLDLRYQARLNLKMWPSVAMGAKVVTFQVVQTY